MEIGIAVTALVIAILAIVLIADVHRRIHNQDSWIRATRDDVHDQRDRIAALEKSTTEEVVSEPEELPPIENEPERNSCRTRRGSYHQWTDGEINQLRALVNIGKTDGQIATIMKMSRSMVTSKRMRIGVENNNRKYVQKVNEWTESELKLLGELYSSGFTVSQMAAYLNRSENAVRCRLQIMRLKLSERKK